MRKIKQILTTALLVAPVLALAQGPGGITEVPVPAGEQVDITKILGTITNWAFGLLLALASVFIVVAAYYYLTSGGDEDKLKKAKNLIIYAVVAIVVAFLARGIVFIVQTLLGVGQ